MAWWSTPAPVAPVLQPLISVRAIRSLATVVGLAILGVLIVRVGSDEALTATARALGWRALLICLPFALIMAVDTLGWRYAFAYDRVPFLRLMAGRMAGEAVNVVSVVAPIGGDAIKVWFLRPHVSYRESVASVIVAKTTITLSQALFLLIGVAVAMALAVDPRLVRAMLWLLLVELIGVGGFLLVQVAGLMSRGARMLTRFRAFQALAAAETLDRTLQDFYRREWRRFGLSVGFHLLGWLMGVLEAWLFLRDAPGSGLARDRAGDRDTRLRGSIRHVLHPREPGRPRRREHGGLRGARIRRAGRAGVQPPPPTTTGRLDRAGRAGAPPGPRPDATGSGGAGVTKVTSASAAA